MNNNTFETIHNNNFISCVLIGKEYQISVSDMDDNFIFQYKCLSKTLARKIVEGFLI